MRKVFFCLVLAVVVAALAGSTRAAAKRYQFTGVVKTVQGSSFTVEKSANEVWDFSTDAATKGTPKVGEKVTVYYRMVATEIEPKATAAVKK